MAGIGMDELDSLHREPGPLRIHVHHYNIRMQILNTANCGIGWSCGKSRVRQNYPRQLCALNPLLEHQEAFGIFRKYADGYRIHGPNTDNYEFRSYRIIVLPECYEQRVTAPSDLCNCVTPTDCDCLHRRGASAIERHAHAAGYLKEHCI